MLAKEHHVKNEHLIHLREAPGRMKHAGDQ